jgi:hypothetical protein
MKVLDYSRVLILGAALFIATLSYGAKISWPVTSRIDYNRITTFSLYEVKDISSSDSWDVYNHIERWFLDPDDEISNGSLMLRFNTPYRGEHFYTLEYDSSNRIVMNGLDLGSRYDLLTELRLDHFDRIFITYTPNYIRGSWDLSHLTELRLETRSTYFDARDFLNRPIPSDHPLAIWDRAYGHSARNTDFAAELPLIVDIGSIYRLSREEIKLLIAIRVHENSYVGNEFGVKDALGTNLIEQAHYAAGTIRNKRNNYSGPLIEPGSGFISDSFIAYLGSFYAPTSGELPREEIEVNRSWVPGVSAIYKTLREYSLSELLSYLE